MIKLVKRFQEIQMKQHLPFVKNVALNFVQLFAKKAARFEAETALLSSSGLKEKRKEKKRQRIWSMQFTILSVSLYISIACVQHSTSLTLNIT